MKEEILYRAKNGQPITHKRCGVCDGIYESYPTQKYCSDQCKRDAVEARDTGNRWIIYNRDGCRCVYCGVTASESELSPDHIIPWVKGGQHTASNIVTSCLECNTSKQHRGLSEETLKYVTDLVNRRNKELSIHPDKLITGSHTHSRT